MHNLITRCNADPSIARKNFIRYLKTTRWIVY